MTSLPYKLSGGRIRKSMDDVAKLVEKKGYGQVDIVPYYRTIGDDPLRKRAYHMAVIADENVVIWNSYVGPSFGGDVYRDPSAIKLLKSAVDLERKLPRHVEAKIHGMVLNPEALGIG